MIGPTRRITAPGLFLLAALYLLILPILAAAEPPYRWPLKAPTHINSTFGEYRPGHLHDGIDLSTERQSGRMVHAVDTGLVDRVFYDPAKYGKTVVLRHPDGTHSWYSHLSSLAGRLKEQFRGTLEPFSSRKTKRPIRVPRGAVIAKTGETGRGMNHLHFSLQKPDGSFMNPLGHFKPEFPFDPRPHVQSVRLFPLDGQSWLEGGARSLRLSGKGPDLVDLWGTVGLDVTLWNRHPNSSARTLPRTIRVLRDGRPILERQFESIADTSAKRFRSLYNERLSNLRPTQFTLHLTPENQRSAWEGLHFKETGDSGTLTIELRTSTGRVTRRNISYRCRRPAFVGREGQPNPSGTSSTRTRRRSNSSLRYASLQLESPAPASNDRRSPRLVTGWIQNRLRIDLRIPTHEVSTPDLTIHQENFTTRIPLIEMEPGHFVSWWIPTMNRDGWHKLRVNYGAAGEMETLTQRVYVQSMRVDKPGAIVSLDGRYSLFNPGRGLKFPSFIQIQPTDEPTPSSPELSLLESPRRIRPQTIRSSRSLELTVNLPEDVHRRNQVGLFVLNPVTNEWDVLSYSHGLTPASRKARVTAGRLVALMVDRQAPRIRKPRFHPGSRRILIPVRENGSGLVSSDIRISEDGSRVDFRWNFDRDQVEIPVPQNRNHLDLTVQIRDRAGNSNQWEGRVETRP